MTRETVSIEACRLNLGELHRLNDFGFYHPSFTCVTSGGDRFEARMRLHVTEPLNPLVIADPRQFDDGGFAANSVGSTVLPRRAGYEETGEARASLSANVRTFEIQADQIAKALWQPFAAKAVAPSSGPIRRLAATCHNPQQVGGGNTILFRYINWLAALGVQTTVYSLGAHPTWTRVEARFRRFDTYDALFAAVAAAEEEAVLLFSMWHIEGMLAAPHRPRRVVCLRQIAEPFHYGLDWQSMQAGKPVIDLLESLPLDAITVSPHLRKRYLKETASPSDLITNGIDLTTFHTAAPSPQTQQGPAGPSVIVSVGDPRHFVKGGTVLAKALEILAARRPERPQRTFRWIIAGTDPGHALPFDLTKSPNLEVVCRPRVSAGDMQQLYASAQVFVNPSLYEGFGLPTLEAMACGAPVVHTDNSGLDEIVQHERDCLIVPPNDPHALADAIERMMEEPGLAERLRAAALDTVSGHSVLAQYDAFVPVFDKLLEGALEPAAAAVLRESIRKEQTGVAQPAPSDKPTSQRRPPLVSVVIPTYNQADYLGAALDSVLAQTYEHWEAVVVNDGSTDGTAAVLAKYAALDSRIRPFETPNRGITATLNEGLRHARGHYFCWLSSDDLYYPEKLRLQVEAFEKLGPDWALVYGSFDFLQEETGRIDETPLLEPTVPGAEFAEALKFDFIDGCSAMIRMSALRRAGGFNGQYRHSQDMEMWMRLASYGFRFHVIPHKLNIRRIHERQGSTTNMIHCRYDAAAMVAFYLSHFHLLELYRYFDTSQPDQLEALLQHLIDRTSHTEANVNHPLLRRTFWTWLVEGLSALPAETAQHAPQEAMERCFKLLVKKRNVTPVIDEYLDWCLETMEAPPPAAPHDPDLTVAGRNIQAAPRSVDPFATALFEYAIRLLIDASTPLFAQELTFHDVNKLVDTPAKLAHSAVRYLAQFPNPHRELAAANANMSMVPASANDALSLFCRLVWPHAAGAFERSIAADPSDGALDAAEATIAALDEADLDSLRAACALQPGEPLLHYWNALTIAHRGDYRQAITEASRTRRLENSRCNEWILSRIARWAEHVAAEPAPDAPGSALHALDDAQVRALADGTYSLSLAARTPKGGRFRAQLRRPYTAAVEQLEISDPTGQSVTVGSTELLDVWTRPLKRGHAARVPRDCAVPAVAFTLMNSSGMGGGPAVVCRYANWLADLGIQVAIYSNDFRPPSPKLKAVYHHIPDDEERYARISEPVVVMYSILEWPALASALANRPEPGARAIYHLCQGVEDHNYHDGSFEDLLARKPVFETLHAVPLGRLVVAPSLERYFASRDSQPPLLVPNGVDLRVFSAAPAARSERITLMAVGAPERPIKGVGDVREALAIVRRERPSWPLALRVLGGTGQAPAGAETIEGVDITYERATSPEQMARIYRSADIVVNAAWYEGYGLPTIEAMACGVPVIQAANQGLEGIVTHEHDCLVVPPHDPAAIAEAIIRLIEMPGERQRLARNALATAGRCGQTAQFDAFVRAFEQVLSVGFDPQRVARIRAGLEPGTLDVRIRKWQQENEPLFSVLVPSFNHARFLPAALDSLRAQTYENWEAIVVDDGSTDETPEVLQQYMARDKRIRAFRKSNGGVASALNEALKRASGEWICWLSADDLFDAEKLQVHVRAIRRHRDRHAFYTRFGYLEESTGTIRKTDLWQPAPEPAFQVSRFFYGPYVHGNAVAVHRRIFDRIGPFNEAAAWAQDFDMWLRVAAVTPWQLLPESTCITRVHPGQSTWHFPEGGSYDSAQSCGEFLNANPFVRLYPFVDLTVPEQARRAVRDALALVANSNAVLHRCGYNPSLLARVVEWFAEQASDAVRGDVRTELESFAVRTRGKLAAASRELLDAALAGTLAEWRFVPADLRQLALSHAACLEAAGDHAEAARIRRFAEDREERQPVLETAGEKQGGQRGQHFRGATALATIAANGPVAVAENPVSQQTNMEQQSDTAFHLDHVRTVAVFGAGRYGKLATELAARCGWTVEYYVDNNANVWNTEVRGITIRPPAALRERPVDLVIVASHAHLDAIAAQLEGLGLVYGSDFISFLAPIQIGSVHLKLTL